jgi:hypothetical protein
MNDSPKMGLLAYAFPPECIGGPLCGQAFRKDGPWLFDDAEAMAWHGNYRASTHRGWPCWTWVQEEESNGEA